MESEELTHCHNLKSLDYLYLNHFRIYLMYHQDKIDSYIYYPDMNF